MCVWGGRVVVVVGVGVLTENNVGNAVKTDETPLRHACVSAEGLIRIGGWGGVQPAVTSTLGIQSN